MDSGVGGLSVYREIAEALPSEKYLYYSDNANCPYGEKSRDFIIQRARQITDHLISEGAQVIAIACNTATAAAIATLRAEYPIPFVGMEPAVKPAALGTVSGVIGVLATAGTLKSSKYLMNRDRYGSSVKVVESVGRGFVELVESGLLEGEEAESTVRASLEPLIRSGADIIVLGCTHYPFLLPVLRKVASQMGAGGIRFIDPAPAVARRLCDVLKEHGIGSEGLDAPDFSYECSGSDEAIRRIMLNLHV